MSVVRAKPPIGGERLEFPDFAKGFAILGIVLFHFFKGYFSGWADHAVTAGGSGVHLFLILSGFGLTLSLNPSSDPLDFYRRRFSKILVPYFIWVSLIFTVNGLLQIYPDRAWYAWMGHLLLFKMFDEGIVNSFGGHFWFLSTLIQLYLAYPLLAAAQRRHRPQVFFLGALGVSLVYMGGLALTGKASLKVYNGFFLQHLWEFCAGMVLARLCTEKGWLFWRQPQAILLACSGFSILLMGLLALKGGPAGKLFNDIPSALAVIGISSLAFIWLGRKAPWVRKAIIFVGGISYHLYLSHMLVWGLIATAWHAYSGGTPEWPLRIAAVAAACAVAWCGHWLLPPGRARKKSSDQRPENPSSRPASQSD